MTSHKIYDYLSIAPYQGASLLLEVGDNLLFGVKKLKQEPGVWGITGIGGKVEEKEGYLDCAVREAHEEIGCSIEIISSTSGHFIDLKGQSHTAQFLDGAFAAVLRYASAPPFRPWEGSNSIVLGVAIYRAKLVGRALPIENLPMLLLIPKKQVFNLIDRYWSYSELTKICIEIREQALLSVSVNDQFRFVDSPEALFLSLKATCSVLDSKDITSLFE